LGITPVLIHESGIYRWEVERQGGRGWRPKWTAKEVVATEEDSFSDLAGEFLSVRRLK